MPAEHRTIRPAPSEGRAPEVPVTGRLAAILFADVVSYTRLLAEDEPGTITELKRVATEVIEPIVRQHGGRIVQHYGDGVLVEFPSAVEGVRCAVGLQRALLAGAGQPDGACKLAYRIALHVGEIVVDADAIYGEGVNVAARLQSLAQPGGIVISGVVHDQVRGRLKLPWRFLGRQRLHNVSERLPAWALDLAPDPSRPSPTRRLLVLGGGALAGAALILVLGVASQGRPPHETALDVAALRALLPGTEWGEFEEDGESHVFFDFYEVTAMDGLSGVGYSQWGPCSLAAGDPCGPATASPAVLAKLADRTDWQVDFFPWRIVRAGDLALHCIWPDTPYEECYFYVKDAAHFRRYLAPRDKPDAYRYHGESAFRPADAWGVKASVIGRAS